MLNDIDMDKPGQLSNCDISDLTRSAGKDALGKKNVCDCFLFARSVDCLCIADCDVPSAFIGPRQDYLLVEAQIVFIFTGTSGVVGKESRFSK
jgi:hypothetical protein